MGLNVLAAKHRQLRDSFTLGAVALIDGAWLRDYANSRSIARPLHMFLRPRNYLEPSR